MVFDYNLILAYIVGIIILFIIGRILLAPIKLIIKLIYNALIGGLLLCILNWIGGYIGFHMALNFFTALVVGILGIPGVLLLFAIQYFIK